MLYLQVDERKKYIRRLKTHQNIQHERRYTFPLQREFVPFQRIKPGRANNGTKHINKACSANTLMKTYVRLKSPTNKRIMLK